MINSGLNLGHCGSQFVRAGRFFGNRTADFETAYAASFFLKPSKKDDPFLIRAGGEAVLDIAEIGLRHDGLAICI